MQITNLQLKQYLLGNLDDQTGTEIGVQIISDEAFEDKLLIAENDLMEDFLDGGLTAREEKLFHENFLICDDRERHLEEINFFRQYSKKHLPVEILTEQDDVREESFWEKLKKLSIFRLSFAVPVMAVLLIGVLLSFYFIQNRNRLSPLESEYAELNRHDFSNAGKYADFSNVSLISDTFRSDGNAIKLKSENLSEKVFFRLGVLFSIPENEILNAELVKDEKIIFRQPDVRVYKNQSGQEFRLFLPKTTLEKGRYQIKIENPKAENSVIKYDFVVE